MLWISHIMPSGCYKEAVGFSKAVGVNHQDSMPGIFGNFWVAFPRHGRLLGLVLLGRWGFTDENCCWCWMGDHQETFLLLLQVFFCCFFSPWMNVFFSKKKPWIAKEIAQRSLREIFGEIRMKNLTQDVSKKCWYCWLTEEIQLTEVEVDSFSHSLQGF